MAEAALRARLPEPGGIEGRVEALGEARTELRRALAEIEDRLPQDKAAIVVFSGDLDKALAAFVIATGAAASGLETSLFFTFWGLSAIRRKDAPATRNGLGERLMALMTPASSEGLGVSKNNFFGLGARMLRSMMKAKQVSSLEDLIALARESGVRMIACAMSLDVMGLRPEELMEGVEQGGVAAYLAEAARARVTLFI